MPAGKKSRRILAVVTTTGATLIGTAVSAPLAHADYNNPVMSDCLYSDPYGSNGLFYNWFWPAEKNLRLGTLQYATCSYTPKSSKVVLASEPTIKSNTIDNCDAPEGSNTLAEAVWVGESYTVTKSKAQSWTVEAGGKSTFIEDYLEPTIKAAYTSTNTTTWSQTKIEQTVRTLTVYPGYKQYIAVYPYMVETTGPVAFTYWQFKDGDSPDGSQVRHFADFSVQTPDLQEGKPRVMYKVVNQKC
ncbi:hypothetical protein ACFZAV_43080 [Streptomyces sp. NPDC008343]|uniref:hypothetical protein n=1 Tax=Streptomyces sp. NPDC008343 TaxID=3364828 RepID=UPI0036E614AE